MNAFSSDKTIRLVLDTNVILDVFHYNDPIFSTLKQAIFERKVQCVTNQDCLDELQRVLHYPQFKLSAEQALAIYEHYISLVMIHPADYPYLIAGLPKCKDKDDQKFLILSRGCLARMLITRDRALLKLAKQAARQEVFTIIAPQHFLL